MRALPLLLAVAVGVLPATAIADVEPAGAYSHAVEFEVPPFHGIEPALGLAYSSQAGNGLAGVGWRLTGFSYITPSRTGGEQLDGMDLVACAPSTTSASCRAGGTHTTRIESFERIAYVDARREWTITSKDGTRRLYKLLGNGTGSALTSVIDTHGNRVTYHHTCEGMECFPDRVSYAGADPATDKVVIARIRRPARPATTSSR
jgi:hypothetical protein